MKNNKASICPIAVLAVFALLFVVAFSSRVHAQSYSYGGSSPEYNHITYQYPVHDTAHYSVTDPYMNLPIEFAAANGYGIWTSTASPGSFSYGAGQKWLINPDSNYDHAAGWVLLGNGLFVPSEKLDTSDRTHHPGCEPPGIVSAGRFSNGDSGTGHFSPGAFPATKPQVTANLLGSVRYVWVDTTTVGGFQRNRFIVEGLNDDRGTHSGTYGDRQIEIALDSLPNPRIKTQIVRDQIYKYRYALTNNNPVISNISESNQFDQFSIACDTKYLYIAWCSNNQIFATALNLNTGKVADTSYNAPVNPLVAGHQFFRPTIACDPRGPHNANLLPEFALAYIDKNKKEVTVKKYKDSSAIASELLDSTGTANHHQYYDPWKGTPQGYSHVLHSKILASSVAGSMAPVYRLYVKTDEGLLLYNLSFSGDTAATYVDGDHLNDTGSNALPYPLNGVHRAVLTPSASGGIVDGPIVAFENPYDGDSLSSYNQFHCMYQLMVTEDTVTHNAAHSPLIIIRGADNGTAGGTYNHLTDTRLLLSQTSEILQDDPSSYFGTVNQMGIHMYWRSGAINYYARNTRAFDENIEENTLATNDCYVSDGTSTGYQHDNGTLGAKLLNKRKMTLFTDANYGAVVNSGALTNDPANGTSSGLYWFNNSINDYSIATLYFGVVGGSSSIISLNIGDSTGTDTARFYTMPLSIYLTALGYDSIVQLIIHPNSYWESYQSPNLITGDPPEFRNVILQGDSAHSTFGTLNIHGGALLSCTLSFTANYGVINMLYEPSVASQWLSTTLVGSNTTGYFQLDAAPAIISQSFVNSYIPPYLEKDVMGILANYHSGSTLPVTFISTTTNYKNMLSGGVGTLKYTLGTGGRVQDSVVFDGDSASLMTFHFVNPYLGKITMRNSTFTNIAGEQIFFERTGSFTHDYDILVDNNSFSLWSGDGYPDGIYIKNFNNDSDYDNLNISNNKFTGSGVYGASMDDAIALENSTGNVLTNKITDSAFTYGIVITSPGGTPVFPYLCNNIIKNMRINGEGQGGVGIQADHNQGYVKLCQIDSCRIGFLSGQSDNSKIVASSILNSKEEGILLQGPTSGAEVDLSGVHGHSNDYAAFDTITGTTTTGHFQVLLADGSQLVDYGTRDTGWHHYGKNNTMGTSDIGITTGSRNIANIDTNYWNGSDAVVGTGITFSPSPSGFLGSETHWIGSISCSGGFELTKLKGDNPLSMKEKVELDSCSYLKQWEAKTPSPGDYQLATEIYDTLRLYIEKCAVSDSVSYDAFKHLDGAVQLMSNDTTRFDSYRAWLISVLYLNKIQPYYFCDCLTSIGGTYQYGQYYPLGYLAVLNYFRQNHRACWGAGADQLYAQDSTSDAKSGYVDDVSHLPSLDSMGLGFLLHGLGDVSPTSSLTSQYLASFTSSPNPFIESTTLQFTLNRMMYTTVAIYDELGRLVWGDGRGYSLEAGTHTIHIDASTFPSGTYYARISTGFGEVQTLKLVHQK